jgi:hypothetical protein
VPRSFEANRQPVAVSVTAAQGPLPVDLGLIEGFFGPVWSWEERHTVMRLLAGHGYRFHLYAPKGDPYLRRRWAEPIPADALARMAAFAADCRAHGVRFGVGLTVLEANQGLDGERLAALTGKVAQLDRIPIDELALLFDDVRGDDPLAAQRQADVVHRCAAATRAGRLLTCPTYYSTDPILDRVFGPRPEGYLADLGRLLDPAVAVFWTGEEVCAREFGLGHLRDVAAILRRPPTLWDNYPVNDGPTMSRFLHLRGFTGRPAALATVIAAHAINPALQPVLGCIPALTLAASYRAADAYRYGAATHAAGRAVLGDCLAGMVLADLRLLEDTGLERLGTRQEQLLARYRSVDHVAAREIVGWLEGRYAVSAEMVQTQ